MPNDSKPLPVLFAEAEERKRALDTFTSQSDPSFQENLAAAIASYDECLSLVDALSLFSPNETLEDLSTTSLQYLVIPYNAAQLYLKSTSGDRKSLVLRAKAAYERFLGVLDQYDMLSKENSKLYELYREDPSKFTTASSSDAVKQRELKIQRFREEKGLKQRLEYLQQNPSALSTDDSAARDLYLAHIAYCVHMTFQDLEMLALELQMLAMAPPAPIQSQQTVGEDHRQRAARSGGYSERLDPPLKQLSDLQGPILDKNGRPLRPFTLLDNRQRLRNGVFRPDHSLPTMTIDEYLEEERKRGGIIEGGGAQSGIRAEPDEDDMQKADEETMKARAWDEFKEANPKGSGNTMNNG